MDYEFAKKLMCDFADATGVTGRSPPRRYLWTDAFAVCNFLGLYRHLGDEQCLRLARDLIDQVHHVLGRYRDNDARQGWISGLSEREGEEHPTIGGLRIGKGLNERGPRERLDPELEWDRDGQYFHYLTKWMHALHCMARETGEQHFRRWAAELAATAHKGFTYERSAAGPKRMVWKMSIDLSRPLVSSSGQHDPLDGLITFLELQSDDGGQRDAPDLHTAITEMSEMCTSASWMTGDSLGIGGLLDDASRLAQLISLRQVDQQQLFAGLLADAESSLQSFVRSFRPEQPVERRLAFRELGLAIGIHGAELARELLMSDRPIAESFQGLLTYRPLAGAIEAFWLTPAHRTNMTWLDHADINSVMLATSLAPQRYLSI